MNSSDFSVIVKGSCKLCDEPVPTTELRTSHLQSENHQKKCAVFQFFTKELRNTKPDQVSILAKRYLLAGVPVLGGEHIYELLVDEKTNERVWICSVCHVADWALETVDEHVHGREHIKNSLQQIQIDENTTYWDQVLRKTDAAAEPERSSLEYAEFLNAVCSRPCDATTAPVAYLYPTDKDELAARLKLRDLDSVTHDLESRKLCEEVTDLHNIEYCNICKESYIVHNDNSDVNEIRELHLSSLTHQANSVFKVHVDALSKTEVFGLPPGINQEQSEDLTSNRIDNVFYGAPVGLEHCVVFAPGSNVLCLLCCCVVAEKDVGAHFSCELHLERYLRSLSPSTVINSEHESAEIRCKKITAELSNRLCSPVKYWIVEGSMPTIFTKISLEEKRKLDVVPVDVVNYKSSKVEICHICNVSFLSTSLCNYESHIFTDEHFDKMLAKQKFVRDDRSMIYKYSDLPKVPRKSNNPFWKDVGDISCVQNFGEFGMELIFKDVVLEKYVCSCCYESFDIEEKDVVINHTRSLQHIRAALSVLNKEVAARLVFTRNQTELKHLILNYIQNFKAPIWEPKLCTFDPEASYRLNRMVKIPRTLIRLSVMEPFSRNNYIRENNLAESCGNIVIPLNDDCVCFTQALGLTNLLLSKLDSSCIVLWCTDCQLSFTLKPNNIKTAWIDHMLSEIHWDRSVELSRNFLGRNCFNDAASKYQPLPYDHSATSGKKKTPWVWNENAQTFEFCVNNKIVYNDVLHRENFHGVSNLYCSLCCENMLLTSQGVTSHVRSLKHILFYMHKYFSKDIDKIETILIQNASEVATARLILRDFITDELRVIPNVVGKIGLYDASPRPNIAPEIQEVLANEACLNTHQMLLVRTLVNVSQLAKVTGSHSLHEMATEAPLLVNPKNHILLQLVLNNVINNVKFPDTRPPDVAPPIVPVVQHAIRNVTGQNGESRFQPAVGPVISKIQLDQGGVPSINPGLKVPSSVPKPVPPPLVPVKLPINNMEEPMDISDDDLPIAPVTRRTHQSPSRSRSRDRFETTGTSYSRSYDFESKHKSRSPRRTPIRRSRSPSLKRHRLISDNIDSRQSYGSYSRSRRSRSPSPIRREVREPRRFTETKEDKSRGFHPRQFTDKRIVYEKSRSKSPSIDRRRYDSDRRSPIYGNGRSRSPLSPIEGFERSSHHFENNYPSPPRDMRSRSPDFHQNLSRGHRNNRSPSPFQRRNDDSRFMSRSESSHSLENLDDSDPRNFMMNNLMRPENHNFMPHQEPMNNSVLIQDRNFVPHPEPVKPPESISYPITFEDLRRQQMIANLPKITPETTILPTVDLTKPPPTISTAPVGVPSNFGMPPSLPYGVPHMSSYAGFSNPLSVPPPVIDIEAIKAKAKRDLYDRDLSKIESITDLIIYLEQQGQDPIPATDPPLLFNEVVKKKKDIIGANCLAQVLCFDQPEFETYLCTLCREWTTVSEMFNHLKSSKHRLGYLSKMYKVQYAKVIVHDDQIVRDKVLHDAAIKICTLEGSKECNLRMRCILNVQQILRIWPDFENFVDNSWKIDDDDDTVTIAPTPISKDSKSRQLRNGASEITESRRERYRERDRDAYKSNDREKERSRYDDRDRERGRERDRDRRRSRSPRDTRRNRRTPTPEDNRPIWEKQADMMRSVIDAAACNPAADLDALQRRLEKARKPEKPAVSSSANGNGFNEEWNKVFEKKDIFKDNAETSTEQKISAAEKRRREQEAEKAQLKQAQKYISTLVLISQEATGPQGVDKDVVDRICAENGVDADDVFSEETLEDAGKRVGGDMIVTFTAIAHHYKNPLQPPPRILQERASTNQPHAVSLLQQIGLDKADIAVLLRKVTKAKLGDEAPSATRYSSRAGLTPEEKRLRRGKRGGVKNRLRAMNAAAAAVAASGGSHYDGNRGGYPTRYTSEYNEHDDSYASPGLPAGYYERFMQSEAQRPPSHQSYPPSRPPPSAYYDAEHYESQRAPSHYQPHYDHPHYQSGPSAPPTISFSARSQGSMAPPPSANPTVPFYADPEPDFHFSEPSSGHSRYEGSSVPHPNHSTGYPTTSRFKDPYSFDSYPSQPARSAEHASASGKTNASGNWEDAARELSNLFK